MKTLSHGNETCIMRNYIRLHLLIYCLTLVAGCDGTSVEDKRVSLVPVKRMTIAGVAPERYVGERIGFLLRDINPEQTRLNNGRLRATFNRHGAAGLACAVSEDGYFLTAYHCVEGTDTLYVISAQETGRLVKARTVWYSKDYDLALIKAPVATKPFPISPGAEPGSVCFCGGGTSGSDSSGRIKSISTAFGLSEIIHDAPLMNGDSGGPLVGQDGRLEGINVRVFTDIELDTTPLRRSSKASMIEENFLKKIIGRDRGFQ